MCCRRQPQRPKIAARARALAARPRMARPRSLSTADQRRRPERHHPPAQVAPSSEGTSSTRSTTSSAAARGCGWGEIPCRLELWGMLPMHDMPTGSSCIVGFRLEWDAQLALEPRSWGHSRTWNRWRHLRVIESTCESACPRGALVPVFSIFPQACDISVSRVFAASHRRRPRSLL